MKVLTLFYLIILLLVSVEAGHAQSDAQLTLSQANVDAGDTVSATLTLRTPAACDTGVFVIFSNGNGQFTVGVQAHKGDTSANLTTTLARDLQGGIYHAIRAFFNACPGYQNQKAFTVPDLSVTVRALPDPNVYPTSADLVLSVTQKQFFDTKIAELNKLDQQLTTRIEGKAADVPELRELLMQIVRLADQDLITTQGQYREQILKSTEKPLPAFFADFHKQYQTLLVQLKAPIPGTGRADTPYRAKLIYVQQQLKKRKPAPENFNGTYPSSVKDVRSTMSDNKTAYRILKDTGRLTFPADLTSHPAGAHIFYKKLIDDDYSDYSGLTDVKASFELANWSFKFHLEGCTDEVRQINPFNEMFDEQHPVEVNAGFEHCRPR